MANPDHIETLKAGVDQWNAWRYRCPDVRPELSDIDVERDVWSGSGFYDLPYFTDLNFAGANLNRIVARNSTFTNCSFDGALINFADLCFSHFAQCSFRNVQMRVTKIGSATFEGCSFQGSDLSYCSAEETDFYGSVLQECALDNVRLVKSNFTDATLRSVSVYGASAWDLVLDGATQRDIWVSADSSTVTVDNIEVAQFIHLMVRNARLRDILDTITSKVVLILGRFTEDRKPILEALRKTLGEQGYVPVLFDFDGPTSRDLTETVSTLAHLSRFVVVDLTDPRSVPHELTVIVPNLPSVPVQPIILRGEKPFGMFDHFRRYEWVLGLREYLSSETGSLADDIIAACEGRLGKRSPNG